MNENRTAIMCAFARAYHSKNAEPPIFNDYLAKRLLGDDEYGMIAGSLTDGIGFFMPDFNGDGQSALDAAVSVIAPPVLARSAFAERSLETACLIGTSVYAAIGSGYDTFAYRSLHRPEGLKVIELDFADVIKDKLRRLERAGIDIPENTFYISAEQKMTSRTAVRLIADGFNSRVKSFCSILGATQYMTVKEFSNILGIIGRLQSPGSSLVFDYHCSEDEKLVSLAAGAGEKMQSTYTYLEIERLLSRFGYLIYEHLNAVEATEQYFSDYNKANPSRPMKTPENSAYCLAVKKL